MKDMNGPLQKMARKIIWSLGAANDVEAIREYLEHSSSSYTKRFLLKVREATKSLKTLPERGRRVPEYPKSGLREIFIDSFRLFYRITDEEVIIVALFHMARDITSLQIP
jgi:plasmid stabilization system protein ParE